MQVVDEITGSLIKYYESTNILIGINNGVTIFGYAHKLNRSIIKILIRINGQTLRVHTCEEFWGDELVYSIKSGCYMLISSTNADRLFEEQNVFGFGDFPYTFARRYEAIESFKLFNNQQKIAKDADYKLGKRLKYTFGLEFETSMGYIPEKVCFRDGLIPLRDGSITGLEYSTVVMEGNGGLNLLSQQLETLKKYTNYNKECSLHIHFGGFPMDPDKIYNLYLLCKKLEDEIQHYTPEYTFYTANYKNSGKDYCKKLDSYGSFDRMYESLVGRRFYGDFTQPHPNDIAREAKWRIPTR